MREAPNPSNRPAAGLRLGGLVACLGLLTTGPGPEGLAPEAARALEAAGEDLARGARRAESESVLGLLGMLGADARTLERLRTRWLQALGRAGPAAAADADARRELGRAAADLRERLARAPEADKTRLARALVAIDDQDEQANGLLGNVRHRDRWVSVERAQELRRRERHAELQRWASQLSIQVEESESTLAPIAALGLSGWHATRASGVTLHSRLPRERAARVLVAALRASALSYAVARDRAEVPRFARGDYLVLPPERFRDALIEASNAAGVGARDALALADHASYQDARGWFTCRWRSEPDLEAQILFDQSRSWLGWTAQPALLAGHVNWIALRALGTTLPHLSWQERSGEPGATPSYSARETGEATSAWRTTERGLFGSRRYLEALVERGEDPPWERSLTDAVGKIQGLDLLKATFVVEYLQERGWFAQVLDATRSRANRVQAFEEILRRPLPELEGEWRRWMLEQEGGLLNRLREPAPASPLQLEVLRELEAVRRAALASAPAGEPVGVGLDAELCEGAERHARYLARHPDQCAAWPGAHEEYPDRAAFSAAGAWAAQNSVIHIGDPRHAVRNWMATFYHRLPLLEPGLAGVGLGSDGRILVADVGSLVRPWHEELWVVWPPEGGRDVPPAFYPELPEPLPGRRTDSLGCPITLQVAGPEPDPADGYALELRRSGPQGEPVDCRLSSPWEPSNPALAPRSAFALIPESPLRPRTRYWARASRGGRAARSLEWTFTTGD